MSCEETFSRVVLTGSNKKDSASRKNQQYEEKVEEFDDRSPLKEED